MNDTGLPTLGVYSLTYLNGSKRRRTFLVPRMHKRVILDTSAVPLKDPTDAQQQMLSGRSSMSGDTRANHGNNWRVTDTTRLEGSVQFNEPETSVGDTLVEDQNLDGARRHNLRARRQLSISSPPMKWQTSRPTIHKLNAPPASQAIYEAAAVAQLATVRATQSSGTSRAEDARVLQRLREGGAKLFIIQKPGKGYRRPAEKTSAAELDIRAVKVKKYNDSQGRREKMENKAIQETDNYIGMIIGYPNHITALKDIDYRHAYVEKLEATSGCRNTIQGASSPASCGSNSRKMNGFLPTDNVDYTCIPNSGITDICTSISSRTENCTSCSSTAYSLKAARRTVASYPSTSSIASVCKDTPGTADISERGTGETILDKSWVSVQSASASQEKLSDGVSATPAIETFRQQYDEEYDDSELPTSSVGGQRRNCLALTVACRLKEGLRYPLLLNVAVCRAREVMMRNGALIVRGPIISGPEMTLCPLHKEYLHCTRRIDVKLMNREEWSTLAAGPHEMVVGCAARKLSPPLSIQVTGLDRRSFYTVALIFLPLGVHYLKSGNIGSLWSESNDVISKHQIAPEYMHHLGLRSGSSWMREPIHFDRLKLTVPPSSKPSCVALERRRMYQPVLQFRCMKHSTAVNVILPELRFIAVYAYQNPQIKLLKARYRKNGLEGIDINNPLRHTRRCYSVSPVDISLPKSPLNNIFQDILYNLEEENVDSPDDAGARAAPTSRRPADDTVLNGQDNEVPEKRRNLVDVSRAPSARSTAGSERPSKASGDYVVEGYECLSLSEREEGSCVGRAADTVVDTAAAHPGGCTASNVNPAPEKLSMVSPSHHSRSIVTANTPVALSKSTTPVDFPTIDDFYTRLARSPLENPGYFDVADICLGDRSPSGTNRRVQNDRLGSPVNVDRRPSSIEALLGITDEDLKFIINRTVHETTSNMPQHIQLCEYSAGEVLSTSPAFSSDWCNSQIAEDIGGGYAFSSTPKTGGDWSSNQGALGMTGDCGALCGTGLISEWVGNLRTEAVTHDYAILHTPNMSAHGSPGRNDSLETVSETDRAVMFLLQDAEAAKAKVSRCIDDNTRQVDFAASYNDEDSLFEPSWKWYAHDAKGESSA
ncbi:uncharacterized protein LOC135391680 [Ornithodoros turicata]|uniref:uncharacterized protein LOC135391680 n=1 Tax=Ornithodoros turicata TaxID=34597 RepID=UPI003139DBFD